MRSFRGRGNGRELTSPETGSDAVGREALRRQGESLQPSSMYRKIAPMPYLQRKGFLQPDQVRTFAHGKVEVLQLGESANDYARGRVPRAVRRLRGTRMVFVLRR